jgi:hypothetical protein
MKLFFEKEIEKKKKFSVSSKSRRVPTALVMCTVVPSQSRCNAERFPVSPYAESRIT